MRLFIAIPLPDEIKATLQNIQQTLPEGVRKQPIEQMHITLRFLGETSQKKAKRVESQLNEIKAEAFTLSLKGAGTFPQKGRPKIIWAGVKGTEPLFSLYKKIEEVCANNGFEPEKRTYVPHITLGKVKKASSYEVKNWIKNLEQEIDMKLKTNSFILYESVFIKGGVKHATLKEYILN